MERSKQAARMQAVGLLAMGICLAALVATQSGCMSALAAAAWVIKGHDIDPDFHGLKGKRVAVVCRPLTQLEYSAGNASSELATKVGELLKKKVRKIEIVDPERIAEWTDEHNWNDYTEIGEALDVDLVLGIDLREFGLYQGMTLYQGHASTTVAVYDMRNGGKITYQKSLPRSIYPPNAAVPASEKPVDEFRRQYLAVLADEIGRQFYHYDGLHDVARDADALR